MGFDEQEYTKSFDIRSWKKLLPFLKPYRGLIGAVIALNLLVAIVDIALPLFQRYAINEFIETGDTAGLPWFALFYGVVIGAQALAVIPGLSRSGTTLAAGVLCGLSREESADFSFLMSIPVIAGAVAAELIKLLAGSGYAAAISWQCLAVGGAFAAVFGFLSVKCMLRTVKGGKLIWFSVYLAVLAAALLALQIIF